MKCAQIMTRKVITVVPSDPLELAAQRMLEHHISGLPVVDTQGFPIGMVTEGDLLKRAEIGTAPRLSSWNALRLGPARLAERYVQTHGRSVEQIMTRGAVTATEQTSLAAVVALMESRNIRRIPITREGRLVGIVSRTDLLHALAQLLPAERSAAASDAAIRSAILREVKGQPWAPRDMVAIRVANGTVELNGLVTSPAQRDALRVVAQNTVGVKKVVGDLVWVEADTGLAIDA
jgi:CBS domain-containing protein